MNRFKPILLFYYLALSTLAIGQDSETQNSIRTEYGVARTGSGDLPGYTLYVEYARSIADRLTIGPAIGVLNFSAVHSTLYRQSYARSIDLTFYYYPIKGDFFKLELGAGVLYRNWQFHIATGPNLGYTDSDISVEPSSFGSYSKNTIGYTVSAGTIFTLSRIVDMPLRIVLQNDSNADLTLSARIGLRVNF